MTDLRNYNKQFIIEFIELYRSHPCLWKVKSTEYSDRDKKNKVYEDVIKKLQEVDNSATRDSVKKRIDSLRGCFRKELKKVMQSRKSGSGTEDIYKPHLWYYEYLLFLTDQETPRSTVTNIGDEASSNADETNYTPMQSPTSPFEIDVTDRSQSVSSNTPSVPSSVRSSNSTKKRRVKERADEVFEKVNAKLDMHVQEDKFTVVGKNVSNKLRDLPPDAALMAEKFISDILFEAALGNISKHTKMSLTEKMSGNRLPQEFATNPINVNYHNQRHDSSSSHQADLDYRGNYQATYQILLSSNDARSFLENFSPDYNIIISYTGCM